MKKTFKGVLAVFLAFSCLAGCQSGANDVQTTAKDPETTAPAPVDPEAKELEELIEYFRSEAANFKASDFGETAKMSSEYASPSVYPVKGQHPRVYVNSDMLEAVRANLDAPQNASARKEYLQSSEKGISGKFKDDVFGLLSCIEAKAFRYLLTGEKQYGYMAIYAIKNAILTIDQSGITDPYRAYGLTMYVSACVYDWCYDLMTQEDKEHIINGVLNKLGSRMEVGCPPSGGGVIAHHSTENQVLRDYLAFAIACFDERPDIYEFVGGRLFSEFVPAQNFMLASGKHWEGAYYGPFRYVNLMDAQLLISAMTNGKTELFNAEDLHKTADSFLDFTLPGFTHDRIHVFEIGDVASSTWTDYYAAYFYASATFGDAALKGFSVIRYNGQTKFGEIMNNNYISPVRYLIVNDPSLEAKDPFAGRSLVNVTNYPASAIFARSAWDDKDAVAVYMTMPEFYSASHSHAEAGSFQIYYKGMLASDSGYYTSHGLGHHGAYTRQTIASNSLLIYNPELETTGGWNDHVYSGGQSLIQDGSRITTPYTLEKAKTSAAMDQLTILGKIAKVRDGELDYSYLAGDMTNAYDAQTVDEVTRHMLSVMTGDDAHPMVFATFDRITSDSASYKKTVLLHSQTAPKVTGDGFISIINGNGKLVAQSLATEMKCTVYGDGKGAEYTIGSKIYKPDSYNTNDPDYRIELSPANESLTDRMLTLYYVTDASDASPCVKAEEIITEKLIGAKIFDRVLLFAKDKGELRDKLTFSVSGDGEFEYYAAGIAAGTWVVSVNGTAYTTVEVTDGEGILNFRAVAGNITIELK